MTIKRTRLDEGVNLIPTDTILDKEGDLSVSIADKELKVQLDSATRTVVTEDQVQDLTNKTIDADNNTVSNLEVDNLKVEVLNTSTTLAGATNTQIPSALAVKEYVDSSSGAVQSDVDDLVTLSGVPSNSTDLGTFTGNIIPDNSTNKQALQSLETSVDAHTSVIMDLSEEIQDLAVLSGVPIDSTDLGTFTGTTIPDNSTIKQALQALETSNETKASQSDFDLLVGEVNLKADELDLLAHTGASSGVHGVTGNVVGTTDSQTLSNKTLTSPTINGGSVTNSSIVTPVRADVKQDTFVNLVTYASTATNGQLVFATDNKKMYQVIDGALQDVGGGGQTLDNLFQLTADEPVGDWTNLDGGFSISKVNPIQGEASYVLEMTNLYSATHKVIPVDEVFRGKTLALTLNYTMTQGAARVSLLDQTNTIIEGTTFDLALGSGIQKFGTTVFIPSTVTGIRFQMQARATVASQSIKFDNVELSSDVLGVIDYSTIPVGTIIESMLTEAQIQAQSGAGIILADGRDVTGSRYHAITGNTTVPDLRGVFLRGKANGSSRDVERALGNYQEDAFQNHRHIGYNQMLATVRDLVSPTQGNSLDNTSTRFSGMVDGVTARISSETRPKNVTVNFFIKINDTNLSIVAPTDQVTERSIAFRWRSPAQATEANLSATGQIGDYVTGQYAINTNTLTQCTTRPTQTDADMSLNGCRIYTRAYNAASTAALPARFAIKIAEPGQMASCDLKLFKDATKTLTGSLDLVFELNAAFQQGLVNKTFNPFTGILILDAGSTYSTAITINNLAFSDNTTQTNGYICFTASKLAQGLAIPKTNPVAIIKDVKPAGTEGGTATAGAWYDRTLNTLENPYGIVSDLSANKFTLPRGRYLIEGFGCFMRTRAAQNRIIGSLGTEILGSSTWSDVATDTASIPAPFSGIINLVTSEQFSLQYRVQDTRATYGLGGGGVGNTWSNHSFAEIKITKLD